MITGNSTSILELKIPGEKPDEEQSDILTVEEVEDQTREEEEEYILCRQCHHPVTRPADRIEKDGTHRHTFANPHGIVYEIGCFQSAFGCGYTGPATTEFTWFKGYSWRIAICRSCLAHLGWVFLSAGSDQFHGLILDRLT
jgi:hypothetical protein